MLKLLKIILVVMILGVTLAAGCAKNAPEESIAAPDFELKSLKGPTVALSALQGQPVLLNFWARRCPPCRGEMPYFQQLSEDSKWQARGLVILAVNIQESEATVREFMTENGLSFTILLDTAGEVARRYNVSAIPTTYVIDKDGIIKSGMIGAFASKAHIDQVLTDALIEN